MADDTKTDQATEYVVLRRQTVKITPSASGGSLEPAPDGGWLEVGTVTAKTPTAAIKAKAGEQEGTFVAVPARSWQPKTRKIETVKRDVWS